MNHIPLDSSQREDSNGSKTIEIGPIMTKLLHFKVLYYLKIM